MAQLLGHIHGVASKAKITLSDLGSKAKNHAQAFADANDVDVPKRDLVIQFIGASNLPKMDVVGSSDPYFVASLDTLLFYISSVLPNTLTPVWNALWLVRNVPSTSTLYVDVYDKDNDAPNDDYIGRFATSVGAGTKEVEIESPVLKRSRGTFWVKIESSPPLHPEWPPYFFDGPVHYSRHFSPTVGRLTNTSDTRLYSTWKVYLKHVELYFGYGEERVTQHWNREYHAAQVIFTGAGGYAVRSGIQAAHHLLYARTTNNGFGVINSAADVISLLHNHSSVSPSAEPEPTSSKDPPPSSTSTTEGGKPPVHRVKPAVYTYVISTSDASLRFSETGAAFFVDFASKHALHANCAESVYYSGEFHPRPAGGWQNFSDDKEDGEVGWEIVVDNNSGTYSPDPALLPKLKGLLEVNFPGIGIVALAHDDPQLKESREACREYAKKYRGVREQELQPHRAKGEETLFEVARRSAPSLGLGKTGGEEHGGEREVAASERDEMREGARVS